MEQILPSSLQKSITLLKKNIYIYIFCGCCWVSKSCLTLCNPMNCTPPSSSVHGISQARILEWVAVSFSRGSSWPRDQTCVSCIAGRFFTTESPGKHQIRSDQSLSHVLLLWHHRLYIPWNSLGQNTMVGNLFLLQGVFPTQGSNPGLLHCRQILSHLSHQRSPRILEWVAYPLSKGSSQPRNGAGVSCIAGEFFTSWATKIWSFFDNFNYMQ